MEKGLFYDLYDRLREVNFRSYSPDKLSAYLHGYLTVYTMVRIYPWLEAEFGVLYDIHERAKEIARWYEVLVQKKELPGNHRDDLLGWWEAICLYDNVVGLMELPVEEQERLKEERVRLAVRVRQVEDDMIEQFVRMGEVSSVDVGLVFYILAKREFVACNTKYEKKE